jgi:general secretion pathway protein K
MNPPQRQRGIALLTAVILVALATVLAVAIGFNTAMTARRSASSFTVEQGLQFGAGAEALAAYALSEDVGGRRQAGSAGVATQQDYPGESWNQPLPPTELAPDVVLEAKLDDESGKFNLNSLVKADGSVDLDSLQLFEQLLEQLDLEPRWASMIADWIDTDPNSLPNGGEDNQYTLQKPGYRAANAWITSPSELMVMPEFGRERYLTLLPHVTALPPEERAINVCFATGKLLDAIQSVFEQKPTTEYSLDPKVLTKGRAAGCFPPARTLGANTSLPADKAKALNDKLTDQSTYFRLHTWVSIGTTRFALYSLLERRNRQVRLVFRTFGTE